MINKRNVWFMTLFSLILVLSVYYITIPPEIMLESPEANEPVVNITESTILTALRVEADKEMESLMEDLRFILTSVESTTDEKSEAYDKLKALNITRGEEEKLEEMINKNFEFNSFVKIDGDQIRVVVESEKHDMALADKIMSSIQSNYENNKYISVKFQ